jgi:hypothetical protein
MAGWDVTPPALRASDADRDRVLRVLREGSAEGRLSYDSFVRRMELALYARESRELSVLIKDLPAAQETGLAARLAACAGWCAQLSARVQAAWRLPRLPQLILPRAGQTIFTIGRSPGSDLVVADMTVSWHHAELRRVRDHWLLADVGSTNGTRVNGWRAGAGLVVGPGDRVEFGQASFRLTSHR